MNTPRARVRSATTPTVASCSWCIGSGCVIAITQHVGLVCVKEGLGLVPLRADIATDPVGFNNDIGQFFHRLLDDQLAKEAT